MWILLIANYLVALQKHFLLISALFVAVTRADVSHLIADNSLDGYYYPQPIRDEPQGYVYDKPLVRFEVPTQPVDTDGGYLYGAPSNPLSYPENKPAPTVSTHIQFIIGKIKSGYIYI